MNNHEVKPIGEILNSRKDETKVCKTCGASYVVPGWFPPVAASKFTECEECVRKQIKQETAEDIAEAQRKRDLEWRKKRWAELYPFSSWTVADKLPHPEMLEKILAWRFSSKRGLFIHGPSRQGKSRCIWHLAEREFMKGCRFKVIDSGFGFEYASLYSKDAMCAKDWMDDLISADILLADDIFKIKATESAEQAIFYVVDKRLEKERPMWWTTNDTPATLISRLGPDRGPALMERIAETCDSIAFTRK